MITIYHVFAAILIILSILDVVLYPSRVGKPVGPNNYLNWLVVLFQCVIQIIVCVKLINLLS